MPGAVDFCFSRIPVCRIDAGLSCAAVVRQESLLVRFSFRHFVYVFVNDDSKCRDEEKVIKKAETLACIGFQPLWEHTGSNRGPSACKADALNQLSYAPVFIGSAKIAV